MYSVRHHTNDLSVCPLPDSLCTFGAISYEQSIRKVSAWGTMVNTVDVGGWKNRPRKSPQKMKQGT